MPIEMQSDTLVQVRGILNGMIAVAGRLRLYEPKNQMVAQALAHLMLQLEQYLAASGELRLVVARHGFLFNGDFVDRSNPNFQKFANTMFMHGVAAVTWTSEVTAAEIVDFLRLLGRKPSESWDEGGLRGALEDRQIAGIVVQELTEGDFRLLGAGAMAGVAGTASEAQGSDLWDRFALTIAGPSEAGAGCDPLQLASRSNAFLAAHSMEEKLRFVRQLADFLATLQHEKVHIYRMQALTQLTAFVNNLSVDLRRLFLQNAFNLNLRGDFAEGFCTGLSDETILDALHNASFGKGYVPPVVLTLLGRLASDRGIGAELARGTVPAEQSDQVAREMLRPDEFAKYVPEGYRKTLLSLVRSETLDAGLRNRYDLDKGSLQPEQLEMHAAEIVLYLLHHDIDERHRDGVIDSLDAMIETYLAQGEYRAIREIFQACLARGPLFYQKIVRILCEPACLAILLDGPRRHGKERYDDIRELVVAVGYPCIEPLLDRLAMENNRAIRNFYILCLKGLGSPVLSLVVQRLQDPRWYYLRNLLYLLREIGDPSFALKVRPLFTHPHPKVSAEALRTGLFFRDAVAQRMLMEQLAAREPQVVLHAVTLACMARDPKVIERLLELLRKGVLDYHFEIKAAIVKTLGDIAAPQALPALTGLLQSHRLLHGAAHEELKFDIVRSFEHYPLALVRAPLQQLASEAESDLGRLAAEVLGRLEGRSA